ncbi:leucine-rich repeat-containing protein 74B-like [Bolinopsis microptera]|uniref:leucine-rich repeat-containing protein 74B-like n=1 Tax=Bolinopsis microptera TaxID=2820187 RepID=UPI00307AE4B9
MVEAVEPLVIDSLADIRSSEEKRGSIVSDARADVPADSPSSDGYETDLEIEEEKTNYDTTGREVYVNQCKSLNIIPVSYFLRNMQGSEIHMSHHGLGPKGTKAIALALVNNTTVLKLNLADNALEAEGGLYIANMLRENCYITVLDLSENKLGTAGAKSLGDMLHINVNLKEVYLAGNSFTDKDIEHFSEVMKDFRLTHFDLSRNCIGEKGGLLFGPAVAANESLEYLNLSWNNIRRKGAIAIANGLKNNVMLKHMNLSWNGFGDEGAVAIGEALKNNTILTWLDVSHNRITAEGIKFLAKAVEANEGLKYFGVAHNPITSSGACLLLESFGKNSSAVIETVDITNVRVNEDLWAALREAKQILTNLKVIHQPFMEGRKKPNPIASLKDWLGHNKHFELVEVFKRFDEEETMEVSKEVLHEAFQQAHLPFDKNNMEMLIDQLDGEGKEGVNYTTLIDSDQVKWLDECLVRYNANIKE